MSDSVKSIFRRTVLFVITACCAVGLSPDRSSAGSYAGISTEQLIIKFAEGELLTTPLLEDDYICLNTTSGTDTLITLPGVLLLEHLTHVSTGPRAIEGPYLVTMVAAEFQTLSLPCQTPAPHVEYLEPVPEAAPIAGEHVRAWFPDSHKTMLCSFSPYGFGQVQLHAHWDGEPAYDWDNNCDGRNWQWFDRDMDLPQAWAITRGASDVLVAVLDIGFDWMHPELGGDGPQFACTSEESLQYYNNGVIYSNTHDGLGDASNDGRPGLKDVDDDLDGLRDEDSLGRDCRNDAESDVVVGTFEAGHDSTVIDTGRNWVPGELVGRRLYLWGGSSTGWSVRILANSHDSITTEGIYTDGVGRWADWWGHFYSYDPHYRVGDGVNNNEIWPDLEVDDEGWLNDIPFDDDENGAPDDLHGFDFVNRDMGNLCPGEDFSAPDNNVFGRSSHGTTVASMLATSENHGRMMAVAPGVKILPIRVGTGALGGPPISCSGGGGDFTVFPDAVRYAMSFHPDVISVSMGGTDAPIEVLKAIQAAVDSGVVYVHAAGNSNSTTPSWADAISPRLIVAGLNPDGSRWYDPEKPQPSSNYGPWVDVSALGTMLAVARDSIELPYRWPTYGLEAGTSLAAPQVAGVAALVKSAYPHMQRDDIIWMVKRGVDVDIFARYPAGLGALGAGRANAYKALTLYGNVAAVSDTAWSHELWVGGDVLVPAGRTLTLEPGTTVNVAIDDLLSDGSSGALVEFVVNGTMVIAGTPSAPVTFKVFDAGGDSVQYFFDTVVTGTTFTMNEMPSQVAKYVNVSGGSGLSYTGAPYAAVALDYNGDGRGDLLTTSMDDFVRLFRGIAPPMQDPDAPAFIWSTPLPSAPTGARAVVAGDYDNDGDEDIFVAHGTTPKLYHNVGGSFADSTVALGLASLADMSMAATWLDYDRDGWLDLYVVRGTATGTPTCASVDGLQHRLFRNATRDGGGFVDVTDAAGLTGIASIASLSVCASDVDGDHDMDLFVAAASSMGIGANSLLLMNDGTGHLVDKMEDRVAVTVENCPAAEWADMDNDGSPDLVVASDSDAPRILYNSGTGTFLGAAHDLDALGGQSSLKVFDQDLDGWLDVLTLPRNAQESCRLFTSLRGVDGPGFVETTRGAGLADLGIATAAVAGDFNGDGDPDLFLGRPTASSKFMYRCGDRTGGAASEHSYLKLKLHAPEFANNAQGIGARVSVVAGGLVQTHSPDGGSGRGSQGDRTLVFGLGDYNGPISAHVTWPGGWETSVSWPAPPTTIQIIADDTTPEVSNALATCLADPSTGDLTWEFTWDTSVSCDPDLDVVTLEQVGLPCLPSHTTLTVSSDIEHTYESKATGGYRHKFVLVENCFAGCRMKYTMTSLVGTRGSPSSQKSKRIDACLSPQ